MAEQKKQQAQGAAGASRQAGEQEEREGGLARRGGAMAMSPFESPFRRALAEMDWMFDQMQRSMFGTPWRTFGMDRFPELEIEDSEREFVIRAEIPGIDPRDVQVEEREGILTLRAEGREEAGEEGEEGGRTSRYASFYRQISLPADVDTERAQASSRHGVLTIRFPKTEEAESVRRIPVSVEPKEAAPRQAEKAA